VNEWRKFVERTSAVLANLRAGDCQKNLINHFGYDSLEVLTTCGKLNEIKFYKTPVWSDLKTGEGRMSGDSVKFNQENK
jgi:hypothetical protein